MFKSGFVSIVGKPNVGKSTFVNTMVGAKVSIVSWKPQTTRNKIFGIMNGEDYQVVFVDSPGVHKPKNALSEYMMKSVTSAVDGVDEYIYIISCDKKLDDHDMEYINKFAKEGVPFFVLINKCDEVEESAIVERIEALKDIQGITAIIPISARTGKNCDMVRKAILDNMPEGVAYFDRDMYTDKTMRFIASEIVREKALKLLSDEIPYGIGVVVTRFSQRENGIYDIYADIICEKKAHKSIVIGKGGEMIKQISTKSRLDMEKLVDGKVFLTLFVKVKENWRDKDGVLNELGYNPKDI